MISSCEFEVRYGTIRGLKFGTGGARKILAVHGWLDNAASFSPLAPRLEGAEVVSIDLAGHGHSDHRAAGASYHLVDYAPDVVEVADRLGWDQFTLLGHSLGAGVSSLIAAALPDRVQALCLIDGIGPLSGREQEGPDRLRRAISMRSLPAERVRAPHPSVESAVAARLKATRMLPASARLVVERNLCPVQGGYAWRTDRRLTFASPVYLTEAQVLAFLSAIDCPVLLVYADEGVIAHRHTTEKRMAAIRGLTVAAMPGEHHLHMDDAPSVAERVNTFLSAVPSVQ